MLIKFIVMDILTTKHSPINFSASFKEWFSYCIGLTCMFLFTISAYDKIAEHERFTNGLSKVAIIGPYAGIISWLIPIAEIIIGGLLLIPQTSKYGLRAFLALMAVFTMYLSSMWLWAEKLPCHCNLIIEKLSWGEHVIFNLAFIGLAAFALWLVKNKQYKS